MLAGFSDPDGDYFYINDTWTDYGSLTFDYDSLTAYLPVSNSQNLTLDMILEQQGGEDYYLTGLTKKLMDTDKAIRGSKYWYCKGKNIVEIYNETYIKG